MVYKDRCWCLKHDCIEFNQCAYAFTDQVERDAKKWWGDGGGNPDDAPVEFSGSLLPCYRTK